MVVVVLPLVNAGGLGANRKRICVGKGESSPVCRLPPMPPCSRHASGTCETEGKIVREIEGDREGRS